MARAEEGIIPYQEQLGNYNCTARYIWFIFIIPYQEQLGNYNPFLTFGLSRIIIPYQEQLGNYNIHNAHKTPTIIIPYQEQLRNYNPNVLAVTDHFRELIECERLVAKQCFKKFY